MKILWDDRGINLVPKPLYVSMKQAALMALRKYFQADELKKAKFEVCVSFVSDEEIRELNSKYREKDAATDVLSFPTIGTPPPRGNFPMGDIVISTETAARQAEEYGHSQERELIFLLVHGLLHLIGFNHEEDPMDEILMNEIQDAILDEMGLAG